MTSLHARAAAILAGDLRPDIRGVIEELVIVNTQFDRMAQMVLDYWPEQIGKNGTDASLVGIVERRFQEADEAEGELARREIPLPPTEPASPSTDSEAGQ